MCDTCGCGNPDGFTIHGEKPGDGKDPGHPHSHSHDHQHPHTHDHGHTHHTHDHPHDHSHGRVINLNLDILAENNRLAERNRGYFEGREILALNMVSSPGSGKTTILEKTIAAMLPAIAISVIEGDQQTMRDAERIERWLQWTTQLPLTLQKLQAGFPSR